MRFLTLIFNQAIEQPMLVKMPLWKAVAFAAGLCLSMLSYPLCAAPGVAATPLGALRRKMKNGRDLSVRIKARVALVEAVSD